MKLFCILLLTLCSLPAFAQQSLVPLHIFFTPEDEKNFVSDTTSSFNFLPSEVDLRNQDTAVKDQGKTGYCTAFAGVAIMENLLNRSGTDLSEWDAWSKYRQYSCAAFVRALQTKYICDEAEYPQGGKRSKKCSENSWVRIKSTKVLTTVDGMKESLAKGKPVYIGMTTPNSMLRCDETITTKTTAANGGHALAIVGYKTEGSETFALLKNSWGADCGMNGYHWYSMSICKKTGFYCLMWEISELEVR